jgi:hypothetical protein
MRDEGLSVQQGMTSKRKKLFGRVLASLVQRGDERGHILGSFPLTVLGRYVPRRRRRVFEDKEVLRTCGP